MDKITEKRNNFLPKKKKKSLLDFIVLMFKTNCKKTLKMNVSAKSRISLDTKCNGDIGFMADYNFT